MAPLSATKIKLTTQGMASAAKQPEPLLRGTSVTVSSEAPSKSLTLAMRGVIKEHMNQKDQNCTFTAARNGGN